MSFKPISPRSLGPAHRRARVTAALNKQGRGLALALHISAELVRALGWHAGERVELAVGDGAHLGWVQLTRVDRDGEGFRLIAGSTKAKEPALMFKVANLARFPAPVLEAPHAAAECIYKVEAGVLLVELPAWFYVVEPAAPKRQRPPRVSSAAAV